MHQQGGTIKETLDSIASRGYVLPAIQREFVWRPEQVCNLFDSLMQGYPFGEFMFWRVEAQNAGQYRWYDFVREYHQRDNPHCPELGPIHDKPLTAVLDGQQRLTAFNIGLRGSMAKNCPTGGGTAPTPSPRGCWHLICWHPRTPMKKAAAIPSSSSMRTASVRRTLGCGSGCQTS